MKKNYILIFCSLFVFLISYNSLEAQTTLSPGDVVIIDINSDDDIFSFMPLVDLEVGTVIKFTDEAWLDGTGGTTLGFRGTGEDTGIYTVSGSTVSRGTVITYNSSSPPADFSGEVINGLSVSGDQLLVYQGEDSSPTFIFAVQTNSTQWQTGADANSTNTSALPSGLTNDVNAIAVGAGSGVGSEFDNSYYSGTTSGTYGDIAALIGNSANWTGFNTNAYTPASSFSFSGITWDASAATTDWGTATNWSGDVLPTKFDDITIPDLSNEPVIGASTNATTYSLTIDASSTISITGGGSLTVSGNLTNNGAFTVNSGASLIVSGTSSGNITYNRNLATTNWYLVGVPVAGETIEDMIASNSFDTGTGSNIGWAPYDNSQATATGRWDYQTAASTGSLTSGGGYSVKLSTAGTLTFAGTMETADIGVAISDGTGSGGNAFNLVGNPYPSFLAANSNADGTNNLLTVNTGSLTEETMWLWNQATGSYDAYNQLSAAFYIAPTQGFFVSSTGSNTFNFTEVMQSHQSSDTFQRNPSTHPHIVLSVTEGSNVRNTDVYYVDGTTTGFDNGYDSSIFGGVPNSFVIYTHTVADGSGRDLGIQSLPNSDLESMVIPVGIKAASGSEITISALASNLPAGINVYLEDKTDNSFTLLNDTESFTTTLASDLDGIGRFYLHTNSEALSTNDPNLSNISMYTFEGNTLRIVGVQSGNAKVSIYNILGTQVAKTSFMGNGLNDISLPKVRTGVYIIQLETESGTLNKKVIIE